MATTTPTRNRRARVSYSPSQLQQMETLFGRSQYPDPLILESLSEGTSIPIHKLCTWFQNRRSKFRRESKKGHIDWMRGQLFDGQKSEKKQPTGGAVLLSTHVLSPATTEHSHDQDVPTANIHHLPVMDTVAPVLQPAQPAARDHGFSYHAMNGYIQQRDERQSPHTKSPDFSPPNPCIQEEYRPACAYQSSSYTTSPHAMSSFPVDTGHAYTNCYNMNINISTCSQMNYLSHPDHPWSYRYNQTNEDRKHSLYNGQ